MTSKELVPCDYFSSFTLSIIDATVSCECIEKLFQIIEIFDLVLTDLLKCGEHFHFFWSNFVPLFRGFASATGKVINKIFTNKISFVWICFKNLLENKY